MLFPESGSGVPTCAKQYAVSPWNFVVLGHGGGGLAVAKVESTNFWAKVETEV